MPGGAQVAVRLSESRGAGGTRAAAVIAVATLAAVLLVFLPVGAGAAGQMWVARTLPMMKNFPGHSVSCSANGCVALTSECAPGGCGGLARVTPLGSSNAGVSWVKGTFPGSVGAPTYVACASAKACVATATQGPLGPGGHRQRRQIVDQPRGDPVQPGRCGVLEPHDVRSPGRHDRVPHGRG